MEEYIKSILNPDNYKDNEITIQELGIENIAVIMNSIFSGGIQQVMFNILDKDTDIKYSFIYRIPSGLQYVELPRITFWCFVYLIRTNDIPYHIDYNIPPEDYEEEWDFMLKRAEREWNKYYG